MRVLAMLLLVLLFGCTKEHNQFLGLRTGEILNYKVLKKGDNDAPMLASELNPFYEIEYSNLSFSNVGVALTELREAEIKEGFELKNDKKIWGFVFFNRDNKASPCQESDYEKIIKELGIDTSFHTVFDGKKSELDKGFYRWISFYKNGISYTVICREDSMAVKVLDYNILLKSSGNEKTKEFFKDTINKMDEMVKRKL